MVTVVITSRIITSVFMIVLSCSTCFPVAPAYQYSIPKIDVTPPAPRSPPPSLSIRAVRIDVAVRPVSYSMIRVSTKKTAIAL